MTTEIQADGMTAEIMSSLVLNGDVSKLSASQKIQYYNALCHRTGLDPTTQPFKLITLNGKQVLYADKGATQQLSQVHKISHEVLKKETINDIYIVTTRSTNADGRFTDEDGAVNIKGLSGDNLANALMKTLTKSKRRGVLALCGLGMLDESEIETIPNARPVSSKPEVDMPVMREPESAAEAEPVQRTGRVITEKQRKRLFGIAMTAGMKKDEFKGWLMDNFTRSSSTEITMDEYDVICKAAEGYGHATQE